MSGSVRGPLRRLAGSFEQAVCAALLAGLVVVVSAAVISRFVLNAPLTWPEELARFLLVALTFFGAALAARRGEHILVNYVGTFLPARAHLWTTLVVDLLTCAFLVLFTILGLQMIDRMWVSVSPALSIRMGFVYICVPVATTLMTVHTLRQVGATVRALRSTR